MARDTGLKRSRRALPAVLAAFALTLALLPTVAGAAARCAPAQHEGGDWPNQGNDVFNSRSQPKETKIGPAQARTLAPVWEVNATSVEAAGSFQGTPVIANGCVFVGSASGWVLAINADNGKLVWKTKLAQAINNSVTVDGDRVYAISGLRAAALDLDSGKLLWESDFVDEQDGNDTYGSPVVYTRPGKAGGVAKRVLFVGISGGGAELGDESERHAFQGRYALINADTGKIIKREWVIPRKDWKDGYAGGGIWATPALDPKSGHIFVGSANPFQPEVQHERTNAILKIDMDPRRATFGKIVGHYQGTLDEYVEGFSDAPCADIPGNPPPWYPQGLGACMDQDLDFGASPNLFRDDQGRLLVGEGQKSGEYHVLNTKTMKREYVSLVGPPTALGGIVGSTAIDDGAVYGPITVGGYVWSVDRADGGLRWVSPIGDGPHWAHAVSVANGVAYTIDIPGNLRAFDTATGAPLLVRPQTSAPAANLGGGVAIARNTVYGVTGTRVVALRPDASLPSPPEGGGGGGGGGGEGAPAPGSVVVATPGSFSAGYTTPVAPYLPGGEMSFVNGDSLMHDVVASVYGKGDQPWCKDFPNGKCPLFWSPLVGLGETTTISGVDRLKPGQTYPFYCSLHPGMQGQIVVAGA